MPQQKLNKQSLGQGQDPTFPRLLGERLCLDFVNSIEGRAGPQPHDFLENYEALVHWGMHASLLSKEEERALLQLAQQQPEQAEATWAMALRVRDTLYSIFVALARGEHPTPAALRALQQAYLKVMSHAELTPSSAGFTWTWKSTLTLDRMLWPVVQSAVDLLASTVVARVRECPGCGDCGWLFVDISKAGKRQWCSMEGCGSRAKMRRLYQRQHRQNARG
ncbi:CGNR zinc finger domain-containing protein [Deinococcus ruber]|uniref:Zinc finger CGNR domain-containing protein n=1 Tax=Deinococcus ruber TaxID=1848197 RepID=A0A918CGM9_9DEIO|nr:ABATE domain-containing protein [Deinococcus ruber]GGR23200.1 hypothetical protein GCM10008957_38930 [Deinococcus ruber]